jgi:hypothetical protein
MQEERIDARGLGEDSSNGAHRRRHGRSRHGLVRITEWPGREMRVGGVAGERLQRERMDDF